MEKTNNIVSDVNNEYRKVRFAFTKLTAKEKARHARTMSYMKFVANIFQISDKTLRSEWKDFEEKLQAWYEENPKRLYFNPLLMKEFAGVQDAHKQGFSILENILKTDIDAVRFTS